MQQNKINILCARPLEDSLINEANQKGVEIDVLSFIENKPIQSIKVKQEIKNALLQSATVVFTSMNAVEVVANELHEQQPDWSVYCIGTATNKLVEKYFGEDVIAGTAPNAADLAELIVKKSYADEVIFFCGNQRRDELPEILRHNDIDVIEIVVYETLAVTHKIEKTYNGILFFSPSAVESFFSNNTINQQTILFAIGNTTADAIKEFSNNKILISATPGKENLVEQMIEYFK